MTTEITIKAPPASIVMIDQTTAFCDLHSIDNYIFVNIYSLI
jgi:hypothetical protein